MPTHQSITANPPASHDAPPEFEAISPAEMKDRLAASQLEQDNLRDALEAANARERMLAHELQHRVQNMLALIHSVFRRTFDSGASEDEPVEHFGGRLGTIARYHAVMASNGLGGVDLADMVREELRTVQCMEGPGCTIKGPSVRLSEKACELMGLVIHELATNAIKFGALCHGGKLAVQWSVTGAPATLRFSWKETGVPLLSAAPRPQGFGQNLVEEALPYQLGATTSFDFKPGGIECSISLPLPDLGDSATRI